MMYFFGVVLYNIYIFYDRVVYGYVFKDFYDENDVKIHSILILSFFQWFNLCFAILSTIYTVLYKENMPTFAFVLGLILINIINFRIYYRGGEAFKKFVDNKPMYFSNKTVSALITIMYIVLTFFLWFLAAQFGRQIITGN